MDCCFSILLFFFFLEYTKMLKCLKFPDFQQWAPKHPAFHDLIGCCQMALQHTHTFFHFSSSSFHRATTLVFAPKKSRWLSLQKRLAVRCGLIPTSAGLCRLVIPRKCAAAVRGCGFGACVCVCAHAQTYRRRPSESSNIRTAHG